MNNANNRTNLPAPRYSATSDYDQKRAQIKSVVLALCSVTSPPQGASDDLEVVADLYIGVLMNYSFEAVREAINAAMRGKIGNTKYRPTPAQLCEFIDNAAAAQIERVDTAQQTRAKYLTEERPQISPERRKELADSIRASVARSAPPKEGEGPRKAIDARDAKEQAAQAKAEAELRLASGMYTGEGPCRASPALLKTLREQGAI